MMKKFGLIDGIYIGLMLLSIGLIYTEIIHPMIGLLLLIISSSYYYLINQFKGSLMKTSIFALANIGLILLLAFL